MVVTEAPSLFFFFFAGIPWLVEAEIPRNSHYQSILSEVLAVRAAVTGFIYKPGMQLQYKLLWRNLREQERRAIYTH